MRSDCFQWEEDDMFYDEEPAEEGFLEFVIPAIIGATQGREQGRAEAEAAARAARPAATVPAAVAPGGGGGMDPATIIALATALRGGPSTPASGGGQGDAAQGALLGSLAAGGLRPPTTAAVLPAGLSTPGVSEPRLEALARDTTRAVDGTLSPQLGRIGDMLDYAEAQRSATSEHNALMRRDAFQSRVIGDLTALRQAASSRSTASPDASRARLERVVQVLLR